jgi:succinate dehydrogenase hydrophobic anchor subunit
MQLVLGVYLLFKEGLRYNVKKCGRGNKLQSFLQRMTALVLIAFFVFHIGTLHQWGFHLLSRFFGWEFLKPFASGGIFSTANVYGSTVHGIRFLWSTTEPDHVLNWFFAVFTLLGAWAAVYHVAN